MKLTELEPQFLRYVLVDGKEEHHFTDTLTEAHGIMFLCPKCFQDDPRGPVGCHRVICWSRSRGVPESARPGPGRWKMDGTGFHDLTLNTDPPNNMRSVQLTGGCAWHGHITNGDAT